MARSAGPRHGLNPWMTTAFGTASRDGWSSWKASWMPSTLCIPALKLQRPILAGIAREMQRACLFQDALLERVQSLRYDKPSRWWNLEWDDDSETVVVTFVTFLELEDARAFIKSELDQLRAAGDPLIWSSRDIRYIKGDLASTMGPGWLERLGFERAPIIVTFGPDTWWAKIRWYLWDVVEEALGLRIG